MRYAWFLLFSPFVRRAKSATGYRGLACHTGPAKVSMVSLLLSVAWLITGVEKSLDTARTSVGHGRASPLTAWRHCARELFQARGPLPRTARAPGHRATGHRALGHRALGHRASGHRMTAHQPRAP